MDGSRAADFKKKDGLGRIRTGDLRHVKTPFMAPSAVPNPPTPQYNRLDHEPFFIPQVLSDLALQFTLDDLTTYVERRKYGLSKYSINSIEPFTKSSVGLHKRHH